MGFFLLTIFILAILFSLSYIFKKASLLPSYILTLIIITISLYFGLNLYESSNNISKIIFAIIFFIIILILSFGGIGLIIFLIFNTYKTVKNEGRKLPNLLTLIFVIILILVWAISKTNIDLPYAILLLTNLIQLLIYAYLAHILHFIVALMLCNLSFAKTNQNYIIVCGAGIKKNGDLTPLLASRVDKAISFYYKQKAKSSVLPKLVFSGGQGNDEIISEALAMKNYAIKKGVAKTDILIENESTSTFENMKFSKQVIINDFKSEKFNAIYVSSNYHLLRTGIIARKAKLKINGIGSKTKFYYLPNAILREYIAYIFMRIRFNITFILGFIIAYIVFVWFLRIV